MSDRNLKDASARVAFAAMIHDLGKFAERARIEVDDALLEAHLAQYCPRHGEGSRQWYSHRHAAYTALAVDAIEPFLPRLVGKVFTPFADWKTRQVDDSLINAAARHHKPETFLQWVVATADRVASGFDRQNWDKYNKASDENLDTGKTHYTARMLTLFEQVFRTGDVKPAKMVYRYPLKPLSVDALFPRKRLECEPSDNTTGQKEYRKLWDSFLEHIARIPASHREDWSLWLDHFDSLWMTFTHAIPAATAFGTRPDVSLYDHSHTTAALATALWRYHHDRKDDEQEARRKMASYADWDEQKLLIIQGDFHGIQKFIFSEGSETSKRAAKLLRGRSFMVSLLVELAALKLLDELHLPGTSQVINAAGKFMIVAPNTPQSHEALQRVQHELNQWFLSRTFGQSGIGIVAEPASCKDFVGNRTDGKSPFAQLMARLHARLEQAKYARWNMLGEQAPSPVFTGFLDSFDNTKGVCSITGQLPAEEPLDEAGDRYISRFAKSQIRLGELLARPNYTRLVIARSLTNESNLETIPIDIFGWQVAFTTPEEVSGKFAPLIETGDLLRMIDFSLPQGKPQDVLFGGYARRNLNAYVPLFKPEDYQHREALYQSLSEVPKPGQIKPLDLIARDNMTPIKDDLGAFEGEEALMTLKGDVDDLGEIFRVGLAGQMTFARMATLSRQLDAFFSLFLPWVCAKVSGDMDVAVREWLNSVELDCSSDNFTSTYTVFAGGDDFFLIGPWRSQVALAQAMRKAFVVYVAKNERIHFSLGMVQHKPGGPIRHFSEAAEEALDEAKAIDTTKADARASEITNRKAGEGKNAVTLYGETVSWPKFDELIALKEEIDRLRAELGDVLSTGYLYSLIELTDMAAEASSDPLKNIWASRFAYRTDRQVAQLRAQGRTLPVEKQRHWSLRLKDILGERGIRAYKRAFKIPLFLYFYELRQRKFKQTDMTSEKEIIHE